MYLSRSYWIFSACRLKKNMRTRDSLLVKIMRPREKTCVPIRVILRFRELCPVVAVCSGTIYLQLLLWQQTNLGPYCLQSCWDGSSTFFEKFFQEYHQSVKQFGSRTGQTFCQACQTVWIQNRPDILPGLIWVQTVCKGYQQMTQGGKELDSYYGI